MCVYLLGHTCVHQLLDAMHGHGGVHVCVGVQECIGCLTADGNDGQQ